MITKDSFWQLAVLYTILVALISVNLFWKYSIHFEILAFLLAWLGIFSVNKMEKNLNKNLHIFIFVLAIFLIIFFRVTPYLQNNIPLGYDAGLYRYGIENGLEYKDGWILDGGMEPGFLYLMEIFKIFFSVDTILIGVFIAFNVLLGVAIWFYTREEYGNLPAALAVLVYSISAVQFKVFGLMYYKNVVGLCIVFFAMLFLKKYEGWERKRYLVAFIALAGFLGAVHRPTFYIFGISYFLYAFIRPYKWETKEYRKYEMKRNVLYGVIILGIALTFYLGGFMSAITTMFSPVLRGFTSPGESPGTFITFFSYQFVVLTYLPFALIGLFYSVKKKNFNVITMWAILSLIIVYFQFFFFNRFIIHLDIALIVFSGVGFSILIKEKKAVGIGIAIIMLASLVVVNYSEAQNAKPLINQSELNLIQGLGNRINGSLMVISSEYSPWVIGYSELEGKNIIAPGMFDTNVWDKNEWKIFWDGKNVEILMDDYPGDVYLFAGTKEFNNSCFSEYISEKGGKVYKYVCR